MDKKDNLISQNELDSLLDAFSNAINKSSIKENEIYKIKVNGSSFSKLKKSIDYVKKVEKHINILLDIGLKKSNNINKTIKTELELVRIKHYILKIRNLAKKNELYNFQKFLEQILIFLEKRCSFQIETINIFTLEIIKWKICFLTPDIIKTILKHKTDKVINFDNFNNHE